MLEPALLVWSDEFDGTALDTARWVHRRPGPRQRGVNVPGAVTLDGAGHLLITTRRVGEEYHSGMIGTEPTFQRAFGYWEARLEMPKEEGHWAAFWLQSPTMETVGDPRANGTEIDVIEYMASKPDSVIINLHWNGYGKDHRNAGRDTLIAGVGSGFHTFAVEWTPEEYVFYVDRREVWRTREAVSHRPQYAILSVEVGPWAGDIRRAALPDGLRVDYVRVYDRRPW